MKQISNEEFNLAYSNIDNKKIINSVKNRFRKHIPKNELENCGMIALWKALKKWEEDRGRKFTSYLYEMVEWECSRWITADRTEKERIQRVANISRPRTHESVIAADNLEFADMLSVLPNNLASIVECRIVKNMTLNEIGQTYNFSRETARRKLKEAFVTIKDVYRTMPK